MHQKQRQMSETFRLGALLTVVGGFLDTYTYLSRGGVFANAQTGNIVLLGLSLAQGNYEMLLHYLIPILAFAAGVMVTDMVRAHFRPRPAIHWRQLIVAAEFLILLMVAYVPPGRWDAAVNVAVSFVCAMQVESFRKIHGNGIATTMCIGNLRSGTQNWCDFHYTKNKESAFKGMLYYGIILMFIIGAIIGNAFVKLLAEKAILICAAVLFMAFIMMFVDKEKALEQ